MIMVRYKIQMDAIYVVGNSGILLAIVLIDNLGDFLAM